MADVSEAARDFMATFFSTSQKNTVTSHEPHAALNKRRAAYEECLAAGLVTVRPYNRCGSIVINSTDEGFRVAQERFEELARAMFGGEHG